MGFIYLIGESENDNKFKIGVTRSKDILKRKNKLQTGNSNELYIKKYYESEFPFKLETMLHKHFMNNKILNEWFILSEDDIKNFDKICEKYENIFKSLKNNPFFDK